MCNSSRNININSILLLYCYRSRAKVKGYFDEMRTKDEARKRSAIASTCTTRGPLSSNFGLYGSLRSLGLYKGLWQKRLQTFLHTPPPFESISVFAQRRAVTGRQSVRASTRVRRLGSLDHLAVGGRTFPLASPTI